MFRISHENGIAVEEDTIKHCKKLQSVHSDLDPLVYLKAQSRRMITIESLTRYIMGVQRNIQVMLLPQGECKLPKKRFHYSKSSSAGPVLCKV